MDVARGAVRPARDVAIRRRLRVTGGLAGFVAVFFITLYPVPYFILAPGTAVDLSERVRVAGHAPARDRYYLTDVSLRRASLGMLLARFLPGMRVVPEGELVPPGISTRSYDAILVRAMDSSQDVAAVVAERAAGLPVHVPAAVVSIVRVLPISRAGASLAAGDVMQSAEGTAIHSVATLARVLGRRDAGDSIALTVLRRGRVVRVVAKTIRRSGKRKLGIELSLLQPHATLPVRVRYSMSDVAGSSGGLMFALAIYGSLENDARGKGGALGAGASAVAGTGTLDLDGTVGEIEGTQQKLIAAKRAGARIFLVPRENYGDVKGDPDVRIIPVASFHDALVALRGAGIG